MRESDCSRSSTRLLRYSDSSLLTSSRIAMMMLAMSVASAAPAMNCFMVVVPCMAGMGRVPLFLFWRTGLGRGFVLQRTLWRSACSRRCCRLRLR